MLNKAASQTQASIGRRALYGMLFAMALIEALSGITQGYLNPILPALGPVFSIDDPTINGIFLISGVSFAVVTPIISRLGDSYGYRLVLRWSTTIVAAGAFMMALWPSLLTVTAGVVMLTFVVGFIPLMMGILRATSPSDTRRGVAVMIGVLMLTVGGGGLLAGIVGADDPRLGLWVAVPFAVGALISSFVLLDAGVPTRERIAMVPLMACSLGLIGFVVALSMGPEWGWTDLRTVISGVAGIGLLAWWFQRDSRKNAPDGQRFMDLRLLAGQRVRVITVATFFFGFASISYFGINGIFLHADANQTGYGFGAGPLTIAIVMFSGCVLAFLSSLVTSRILTSLGEKATLVIAGSLLTGGFIVMIAAHSSFVGYCAGFALFNLSLGMYQAGTRALSVEGVPVEETSSAAGLNELALAVGAAVGAAVLKLIASSNVEAGHINSAGIDMIWTALAAAAAMAALVSTRYPTMTVKTAR